MKILRRARNNKRKINKKLVIFLTAVCSLFFLFFLVLGFHSVLFPIINDVLDNTTAEDYVEPVDKATGKANVLLLGVDKDGLRTDTIIIASYDLDKNAVNMLSIPRDTRMYIGRQYQKINAAHALSQNGKIKGPQGTIEAVTRLTGIPVNYYVEFSCEAFRNTIDALGGVEIDVPRRMKYSDPVQKLYIDLQPGLQLLDGDKAEQLVRFRKYPRGDIERVEMQQKFVKALAEQKLNLSILDNIPEIFKVLQKDVKTNFTIKDVLKYLPNLRELNTENITMYSLPGDFSGSQYSASYWIADIEGIRTLVNEVFGYDASSISVAPKGKVDTEAQKSAKNADKKDKKDTKQNKKESDNQKNKTNKEKTEGKNDANSVSASPSPSSSPETVSTPKPVKDGKSTDDDIIEPSKSPVPTQKPIIIDDEAVDETKEAVSSGKEDAIEKMLKGIISIDEVERWCGMIDTDAVY